MSQPVIILYDVPSSVPQPWVPSAWRVRLILNYKRLPYRTCWVEFPDVERTMRAINAPPTAIRPDGRPVYTLPAILDPTRIATIRRPEPLVPGSSSALPQLHPHPVLTNANTIVDYLEDAYPARPVILEGTRALQALFVHYITEIFVQPLLPIMIPLSHQRLPPHVQAYFPVPRAMHTGQSDSTSVGVGVSASIGGAHHHHHQDSGVDLTLRREAQWAAVQAQFTFLSRILDRNASGDGDGDGIVVTGHELTHADFALCSILIWIERVAPHEGWARRVRTWDDGRWWRLWKRCEAYMDVF